jgi:diguanylate cyclase (GGDEF)-like protein
MTVALIAFVPRYGPLPLAPLLLASVVGGPVRNRMVERVPPEYVIASVAVFCQAMLGIGIALTGGSLSPALPIMLIGATLVPARFTGRGMWALLSIAMAFMVIPAFAADGMGVFSHPELLVSSVCGMLGMAPLVAAVTGSERQHRQDAARDALTGLPNRRALESQFPVAARAARARGARLAVMTCDVDHFKTVNDTYGHVRGDRVLQALADALRAAARDGDSVCRWGGEEFVLMVVVPHEMAARQAAERLRAAIAANGCDGLPLTISIGVAVVESGAGLQESFDEADAALYRAKALGRNRVVMAAEREPGELIELHGEPATPQSERAAG